MKDRRGKISDLPGLDDFPASNWEKPLDRDSTWGDWEYQAWNHTLLYAPHSYEVDLESCANSAQVLDWIVQIHSKTWATPSTVNDLIRALDDIFEIQASFCPGGLSRAIDSYLFLLARQIHSTKWARINSPPEGA